MQAELIETFLCPSCEADLQPGDEICSHCGASTLATAMNAEPVPAAPHKVQETPLLDRPWFVIGMLFLAAMILGVPFLWRSKGFTTRGKIFWTVMVTIYTIVIFWGFGLVMIWCYRTIVDSMP